MKKAEKMVDTAHMSSLLEELTVEELARGASLVIEGRVRRSNLNPRVAELAEGFRMVLADHEVEVEKSWKGDATAGIPVRVVTQGGAAPGLSSSVDGEAALTAGERVLLFLDPLAEVFRSGPQAPLGVLGGYQGKWTIESRDGVDVALRPDVREPLSLQGLRARLAQGSRGSGAGQA